MKILIFLQGEGSGHMTQALTVSKILREDGHTITGLIVGKTSRRNIPQFFLNRADTFVGSYPTPEFYYSGSNKRVSILKTIIFNLTPARIYSIICSLKYIHKVIMEHKPDLVINFYEPVFGLYTLFYKPKVKIVSIAHQFMIFAKGSYYGQSIVNKQPLKLMSAICNYRSTLTLALSAYSWENNEDCFRVIPPLLRDEVFELEPYDGGYLLCYIFNKEYAADLIIWNNFNSDITIHVFWDNSKAPDEFSYNKSLHFHNIDDKKFLKYLEGCTGLLTTSGFEAICEAAFLGKPVLMTPAHLEQEVNAHEFSLLNMGIISLELNPTLLIEHIEKNKSVLKDNHSFRNRVLSAEKILLDAIHYV